MTYQQELQKMTIKELQDEIRGLDELIHGENSCYGRRDLIRLSEASKEAYHRGYQVTGYRKISLLKM